MKNFVNKSSKSTLVAFALAVILLLVSAVGGSKAALSVYSDEYTAPIATKSIGVTLNEQFGDNAAKAISYNNYGEDAVTGSLLQDLKDEKVVYGSPYDEVLTVTNSGTIDEYVRATVYKYWLKADGKTRDMEVSPDLIDISFVTGNGWTIDDTATTAERTVLYYGSLLGKGETTKPFTDTLTVYVDKNMVNKVTQTTTESQNGDTKYTKYVTTYDYDGYKFVVEVTVDAVQDHNAQDAALSAWGREVTVNNGKLTLK